MDPLSQFLEEVSLEESKKKVEEEDVSKTKKHSHRKVLVCGATGYAGRCEFVINNLQGLFAKNLNREVIGLQIFSSLLS